jgi:DNA/RNA-binding domain of Phe-tRNA-synthetase-like protein
VARSSVEALARRVETGLPRINWLTDIYNAISVKYLLPIGGENFDKYVGAPRLKFATGEELFDTMANGEAVNESPDAGEVVWVDDNGVTCRRWNWRQCVRTRLDLETTTALFIFDGLDLDSAARIEVASNELFTHIANKWPESTVNYRKLSLDNKI